jgi:hypothetical protein
MKSKIYYILILGLLFLHPRYVRALEPKQESLSFHSLSKMQQQPVASSQNSNSFFSADIAVDHDISADVDVDDDDDVSFAARKKLSFERTVCFVAVQHSLLHFCEISRSKYRSSYFYHNPSFYFISLRVFRL